MILWLSDIKKRQAEVMLGAFLSSHLFLCFVVTSSVFVERRALTELHGTSSKRRLSLVEV